MDFKKFPHITDAEWPIMQTLWQNDSATAAEIVSEVTKQRGTSMRTVKTLIRRLIEKGAVGYDVDERDSRIYHYHAMLDRDTVVKEKSNNLLKMVYGNEPSSLLVHFMRDCKLTSNEINMLEQILEAKKDEKE